MLVWSIVICLCLIRNLTLNMSWCNVTFYTVFMSETKPSQWINNIINICYKIYYLVLLNLTPTRHFHYNKTDTWPCKCKPQKMLLYRMNVASSQLSHSHILHRNKHRISLTNILIYIKDMHAYINAYTNRGMICYWLITWQLVEVLVDITCRQWRPALPW